MAKDSLVKASTHERGLEKKKGNRDNWVERAGPGGQGGSLPAYVEHVALDIRDKRGVPESQAIAIAIGAIKRWARGEGNVDANTRAAATKALAEWEKLKASSHAKSAAKKISEAMTVRSMAVGYLNQDLSADEVGNLKVLEAASDAEDAKDKGADEASEGQPSVYCPKDKTKVKPTKGGKCPKCGTDLSKAMAMAKKVSEAVMDILESGMTMAERKKLSRSSFAIPEKAPGAGSYPIHDEEHGRKALQMCSGKPEEGRVKAAVYKRYPNLKKNGGKVKEAASDSETTKLKCPRCDRVQAASNKKCVNCGHDLADARKAKFANS